MQTKGLDSASPGQTNKTLIVIDDDPMVRRYMRVILQQERFRVRDFADGYEALKSIAVMSSEISAIITDVQMPGLDGVTLAGMVRQALPGVPILMVSGSGPSPDASLPFLPKPFEPRSLLNAVHTLLQTSLAPPMELREAS
jgi:DNA-binding response OmpR family regulator